jgi:hypothetical protein
MKRALLRTVFYITVLFLFLILMIPWMLTFEVLFTVAPDANGHYRSNPGLGMLVGGLGAFLNLWIADRGASFLFRLAGLSGDERSSIRKTRRRS